MNHNEVLLIGVAPCEGDEPFEAFVYTVDAPTNLWIGALTEQGSRMGVAFMAHVLNRLLDLDAFEEGDFYVEKDQDGNELTVTVGEEVPVGEEYQAYQARGAPVRKVTVNVMEVAT